MKPVRVCFRSYLDKISQSQLVHEPNVAWYHRRWG